MERKHKLLKEILATIIAFILILAVYITCGTVDLIFVNSSGEKISTQEDVSILSDVVLPEGTLSYTDGQEIKTITSDMDLKLCVGTTLIKNLVTFQWNDSSYRITITQN